MFPDSSECSRGHSSERQSAATTTGRTLLSFHITVGQYIKSIMTTTFQLARPCFALARPGRPVGLIRRCAAPGHTSFAGNGMVRVRSTISSITAVQEDAQVYEGTFGQWTVDEEDIREVMAYRLGITVATVSLLCASSTAFMPDEYPVKQTLLGLLDPITIIGSAGLGTSLALVHIYVAPLKKFLQGLFGIGLAGTLAIMVTQTEPAAQYVDENPIAVLAVGPLFAAVTGLAFKEGLCYGKFEAAGIFFVLPSLLLGHMLGFLSPDSELGLLAAFCILASVFAARKYTQPIKDDLGDKSVFQFQALSEEEQKQRLAQLQTHSKLAEDPDV